MERYRGSRLFFLMALYSILVLLFFMSTGCTTTKERPEGEKGYEKVSFSEILRSPEQYRGKVVRLGGVILNTVNEEKGSTLEILEQPLSWRGRPKVGDVPGGRFLVVSNQFLDKAIYQPDREVTVVGEITGSRTGQVGEAKYNYPVLILQDIRLWKSRSYSGPGNLHIGVGVGGGSGNVGGGVSVGTTF